MKPGKKIKDYCDGVKNKRIKVEFINIIQLNICAGKTKSWLPITPEIVYLDDVLSKVSFENDIKNCNPHLTEQNWRKHMIFEHKNKCIFTGQPLKNIMKID